MLEGLGGPDSDDSDFIRRVKKTKARASKFAKSA